jgi:hypothetical protein
MTGSEEKKGVGWADFTGDLFSGNTTDWGTIQESICGDQSQVTEEHSNAEVAADPESQYQLHSTVQTQNGASNNPYLPNTQDCDESDYGEVLVNDDAHDAISTVTPATFGQRRMPRISAYTRATSNNNASLVDDWKVKRRRKYLVGSIIVVALLLVTIVIAVPIVVKSKSRAGQISKAEMAAVGDQNGPGVGNTKGKDSSAKTPVIEDEDVILDDADDQSQIASGSTSSTDLEKEGMESIQLETIEAEEQISISSENQTASDGNAQSIFDTDTAEFQPAAESPTSPVSSPSASASSSGLSSQSEPTAFNDSSSGSSISGGSSSSGSNNVPEATFSDNTPAPVPVPTNNNVVLSTMNLVAETPPPTYIVADDTPVPTYSFITPAPQPPTLEPTQFTSSVVRISLQTDKQGYETSWCLESIESDSMKGTNTSTVIYSVDENTYSSYQKDSMEFTLPRGTYRFTLRDAFGDGFCCKDFEGYYSITIDGREVIKGGYYRSEISYDFLIGYFPEMTQREKDWLTAHNVRRKQWHEGNGVSYVPLRWSASLAKQAQKWANKLTDDCEIVGIEHEHGVEEGENLAKNTSAGRKGMGQLYPPDNILRRWVDYEAGLPNPYNLHLTQALWRASKYVGCADSLREYEDGGICRIQVCRYARAGNCQMGKYNVTEGDNWLIPMLADESNCPPECPPEGCF